MWTSVVWTQHKLQKQQQQQLWRRWQQQSGLIQMNPGLPGLFILVGGWWLLCSAGVLICCQWSVVVQALCYQGSACSGIGGSVESKHRTCPLLIYPRRMCVCASCVSIRVSVCVRERSLFPWQPPPLTPPPTLPPAIPSPLEENPGGLCVMWFH